MAEPSVGARRQPAREGLVPVARAERQEHDLRAGPLPMAREPLDDLGLVVGRRLALEAEDRARDVHASRLEPRAPAPRRGVAREDVAEHDDEVRCHVEPPRHPCPAEPVAGALVTQPDVTGAVEGARDARALGPVDLVRDPDRHVVGARAARQVRGVEEERAGGRIAHRPRTEARDEVGLRGRAVEPALQGVEEGPGPAEHAAPRAPIVAGGAPVVAGDDVPVGAQQVAASDDDALRLGAAREQPPDGSAREAGVLRRGPAEERHPPRGRGRAAALEEPLEDDRVQEIAVVLDVRRADLAERDHRLAAGGDA